MIKTTETRIKFLNQAELEKLLAVTYPDDAFGGIERTLYLTAAMTGLRQGELIGLRWRDVAASRVPLRTVHGWATLTQRPPRSTRTINRPTRRQRRSTRHLLDTSWE